MPSRRSLPLASTSSRRSLPLLQDLGRLEPLELELALLVGEYVEPGAEPGEPLVVLGVLGDLGVERGLLLGDPGELLVDARDHLARGPLLGAARLRLRYGGGRLRRLDRISRGRLRRLGIEGAREGEVERGGAALE